MVAGVPPKLTDMAVLPELTMQGGSAPVPRLVLVPSRNSGSIATPSMLANGVAGAVYGGVRWLLEVFNTCMYPGDPVVKSLMATQLVGYTPPVLAALSTAVLLGIPRPVT